MARKNLLQSVLGSDDDQLENERRSKYALKGASGKMKASLDTLAENAKKMMEGETVVEIDTNLIDGSFVKDRLSGDDQDYLELKNAIGEKGQDTPVLLRPHPTHNDRYMIVFGHRRVQVSRDLNRPVRAVIKAMDDVDHILAQGQENSARSDLSFIEKSIFAKRLLDLGHTKEVILAALTVDPTLLSRMLSVSQKVAVEIIEAIGPANSIGRDRWEAFKKLAVLPVNKKKVLERIESTEFEKLPSDERFETLLKLLEGSHTKPQKAPGRRLKQTWTPSGGKIKGVIGQSGKLYSISLSSSDAAAFGSYISENLDALYLAFNDTRKEKSK